MCRVVWYSGTTGICGTSNICVGLCGIVEPQAYVGHLIYV